MSVRRAGALCQPDTDMVSSLLFSTAETNPVIRSRGQYCEKNILWINKTEPHGAG